MTAASLPDSSHSEGERQPLLDSTYTCTPHLFPQDQKEESPPPTVQIENIQLERNISVIDAVGMVIGAVAGSGIFVSPTGVIQQVGSVGISLILWTLAGLLNLLLAICYAELGSALPVAGGDYAYVKYILGPLPAFLCLWSTSILMGPIAAAIMGRTIAAYFTQAIGLHGYYPILLIFIAILVNVSVAALNCVSVKWSARIITLLSLFKLVAMAVIIIVGVIKLCQGYTSNFHDAFKGSTNNPGKIVVGFLPGFVSYVGWDLLNALAEEMKNPARDLPVAAITSMLIVTAMYVLMNVAYFTVLTPAEFMMSEAVAMSFAERALPWASWLVPASVILAALGSCVGLYLGITRFTFSGGRDGMFPAVTSFLHIRYMTPLPAIVLMCLVAIFFSSMIYYDIQALLQLAGIIALFKIFLALVALLHLKRTQPSIPRSIKVPYILVLFSVFCLLCMIGVSIYQEPTINGIGLVVFLLGAPLYWLNRATAKSPRATSCMNVLTHFLQKVMLVAPTINQKAD